MSCAVVGVTDREHAQGKSVHAVVQLKSDERTQEDVQAELYDLMGQEIEKSVIPKTMQFVSEMPHTGMGKIDYRRLEKDYDAMTETAAAAN